MSNQCGETTCSSDQICCNKDFSVCCSKDDCFAGACCLDPYVKCYGKDGKPDMCMNPDWEENWEYCSEGYHCCIKKDGTYGMKTTCCKNG